MKLQKIKRKNGTYRYASVPVGPSKTDQSDKNMVDINTIMQNYQKTGLLPQFVEKIGEYLDMTEIPSYMEAHERILHARSLFMQLPSQLRKLMDNKPENLEKFIQNPENADLLKKYGLVETETNKVKPSSQSEKDDQTKPKAASEKKVEKEAKKAD